MTTFGIGGKTRMHHAILLLLVLLLGPVGIVHAVTGSGSATYYHDKFQGRSTANGDRFDQQALTAAHKTLPFGTRVKVTNLETRRSVVVEVNDRIPSSSPSYIDLTKRAARELGFLREGRAPVKVTVLDHQAGDTIAPGK